MPRKPKEVEVAKEEPAGFSIGEALSLGWGIASKHFGLLTSALAIYLIFDVLCMGYERVLAEGDSQSLRWIAGLAQYLLGFPILVWMKAGFLAMGIQLAAGQEASLADLFPSARKAVAFFLGTMVWFLLSCFGTLFLIVPGVLLGLKYIFGPFLMVHRGLGLGEAFKLSARMTRGQMGPLFLFALVSLFVLFLGLMVCCVGVLWSAILLQIAWAIVYWKLLGQIEPELAETAVP